MYFVVFVNTFHSWIAPRMGLEPTHNHSVNDCSDSTELPGGYSLYTSYPAQSDRAGVVRVEPKVDDSRPACPNGLLAGKQSYD